MGKLEDAKRAAALRWGKPVATAPQLDQTTGYINAIRAERGAEPLTPGALEQRDAFRPAHAVAYEREGAPVQRLEVRLRAGERAAMVLAADVAGLPLSVWAREVLLKAAR